jgi:hypothetical protein
MRIALTSVAPLLSAALLFTPCAQAAPPPADIVPDSAALMQLEQHAQQADPREQCYLYTERTHVYAEIAGQLIAAGDMDQANVTLKRIEHYAEIIHSNLVADPKHRRKLKDAEMVMQRTSHRIGEYLHLVSSDDKAELQATLKQVDKVNEELLAQVFAH